MSKNYTSYLIKTLSSIHPSAYVVNKKTINLRSNRRMTKRTFKEIIFNLRAIDDRRDFMEAELGLDMTTYEDKFFNIIETLFKVIFNKQQLALLQAYVYQLYPDKQWDGKITVKIDKEEKEVAFKTADEVWDVLKKLED